MNSRKLKFQLKPQKGKRLSDKGPQHPVAAELEQLATDSIANLRFRYRSLFREDPPGAFGPDLLRRHIADNIQRKFFGGLSKDTERLLRQMIRSDTGISSGQLKLARQIKPGSELVRVWKDKTYRIAIKPDGFAYAGKAYASLSEIASLITGTNWNGPRFFGLRTKTEGAIANGK